MITGRQIKAARALLGWEQAKLSRLAGVSIATIKRMEAQYGVVSARTHNLFAVQKALEDAGMQFLNGGEPGVRLRKAARE